MSASQWIRVSCAALCRIEHVGRFLLLLNINRRKKGLYILSPIGGALALYDTAALHAMGAYPENHAARELRLTLPLSALPAFRSWFYQGIDREKSPFRELQEELVLESELLPQLTPEDISCRYLWTVEEKAPTARQGHTGLMTYYFLEIYDVKFTSARALGPLLNPSSETGAAWVTQDDIIHNRMLPMFVDGEEHDARVNGGLMLPVPQVYPNDMMD